VPSSGQCGPGATATCRADGLARAPRRHAERLRARARLRPHARRVRPLPVRVRLLDRAGMRRRRMQSAARRSLAATQPVRNPVRAPRGSSASQASAQRARRTANAPADRTARRVSSRLLLGPESSGPPAKRRDVARQRTLSPRSSNSSRPNRRGRSTCRCCTPKRRRRWSDSQAGAKPDDPKVATFSFCSSREIIGAA
jgi:hypothetical protein